MRVDTELFNQEDLELTLPKLLILRDRIVIIKNDYDYLQAEALKLNMITESHEVINKLIYINENLSSVEIAIENKALDIFEDCFIQLKYCLN